VALDDFTTEIAQARAEYCRAADKVIEMIRLRYGEDREGFLNFLNNKVENAKPQDKNTDQKRDE